MNADPIVDEVRRVREAYAATFNFDLRAMAADLRRQQRDEGRAVVVRPPKPPRRNSVVRSK